jgi:hypothetical protein
MSGMLERLRRLTARPAPFGALAERDRYHAAAMIYYDLGVLSDADRGDVLTSIYTALRSGGRFAFDLRTPAWRVPAEPSPTWCLGGPGFWRGSPYL